ncbi:MAG: DUF1285 domain-containing protein [Arenicellales bacterium]|nr:DUF1285 domain-containing protein [Arenicellales bacterium]MDP6313514.1 DUF1285 domain-containing protein [Arenicellales bacterium]MDP7120180.1 DUF1285 domain-containing protein [Arenicellales bacterium]MDP7192311.1 DUF1285 domain-containing protein [Arenicellales bacterium]MDP7489228.1 DUF1285 domain-containing protein [Arenicellales bacterium]
MSTADPPELTGLAARLGAADLPPVHAWQPEFCGDMDLRIARDGSWHYQGSPISRVRLVRLLSTVIRREGDEYFLVSPEQKLRIRVDDAPFVAVEMESEGQGQTQRLLFRTNVNDVVAAGRDHPMRVMEHGPAAEPAPYLLVRDGLEALISRAVYYQLAAMVIPASEGDAGVLGVWSDGCFFALGRV